MSDPTKRPARHGWGAGSTAAPQALQAGVGRGPGGPQRPSGKEALVAEGRRQLRWASRVRL